MKATPQPRRSSRTRTPSKRLLSHTDTDSESDRSSRNSRTSTTTSTSRRRSAPNKRARKDQVTSTTASTPSPRSERITGESDTPYADQTQEVVEEEVETEEVHSSDLEEESEQSEEDGEGTRAKLNKRESDLLYGIYRYLEIDENEDWRLLWRHDIGKEFLKKFNKRYLRGHLSYRNRREKEKEKTLRTRAHERREDQEEQNDQGLTAAQEEREDGIASVVEEARIRAREIRDDATAQNVLLEEHVRTGRLYVELLQVKVEETKALRAEIDLLKESFSKKLEEIEVAVSRLSLSQLPPTSQ